MQEVARDLAENWGLVVEEKVERVGEVEESVVAECCGV